MIKDNEVSAPDQLGFGVVIVTYNSANEIAACLSSLFGSSHRNFFVVVCDNSSTDNTVETVRQWACESTDYLGGHGEFTEQRNPPSARQNGTLRSLTLIHTGSNLGYAGAVNIGLRALDADSRVNYFWILNPDSLVREDTMNSYARHLTQEPLVGLLGGRTLYAEEPNAIQSDGGRVGKWTGICHNINLFRLPEDVDRPSASDIEFVCGANIVASRTFYERVGPMREDYFLFYEEVDWAFRRGELPIDYCADAIIYHHGGASTESGTENRLPSAFTNYFNYRSRLRFMWRFRPTAVFTTYAYSVAKILRLVLQGELSRAGCAFRGLHQLPPPKWIEERINST